MKGLKLNKLLKNEIFFHVLFWSGHLFLRLYFRGYFNTFNHNKLFEEFFTLPVRMFGAYFTIYLLKKYLFNRRYLKFSLLIPLSILLVLFIKRLVVYLLMEPILYGKANFYDMNKLLDLDATLRESVYTYPVIVFAVLITILRKWYHDQTIKRKLEKENLTAQLHLLKGQIQPHFLFNTLNNIYSMSIEKSEYTSESILKLSDLLNYMLYQTNTPVVPLSNEIKHIKDYIDLEKLRYESRLEVIFNISGEIKDITIAPLLLLPLIENCFKHGASKLIDDAWISVDININDDKLTAKFENSKDENTTEEMSYGIGLTNVKKRLDILYNNNYELKIFNEKDSFMVILKLNISHIPLHISL